MLLNKANAKRRVEVNEINPLFLLYNVCLSVVTIVCLCVYVFSFSQSARTANMSSATATATTPAAAAASTSSTTNTTISSGDNFNENDVAELVKMGFTREEVLDELRRYNGNKSEATAGLLAKSLKF